MCEQCVKALSLKAPLLAPHAVDTYVEWKYNMPVQPVSPYEVACGASVNFTWSSGNHNVYLVPGGGCCQAAGCLRAAAQGQE